MNSEMGRWPVVAGFEMEVKGRRIEIEVAPRKNAGSPPLWTHKPRMSTGRYPDEDAGKMPAPR